MKYEIEIETESKTIDVTLTAYIEKDEGIGGYEYWGSKEYDSGSEDIFVAELDWDSSKYSEEDNKLIQKYVDENSKNIEDEIIELCKQMY